MSLKKEIYLTSKRTSYFLSGKAPLSKSKKSKFRHDVHSFHVKELLKLSVLTIHVVQVHPFVLKTESIFNAVNGLSKSTIV